MKAGAIGAGVLIVVAGAVTMVYLKGDRLASGQRGTPVAAREAPGGGSIPAVPSSSSAAPSASASATASGPAAGRSSGPPAGRGGWPGAGNTGVPAGRSLKSSNAIRVTKAGTVLDGLDLRGEISVEANNVTIKNTRIITSGDWGIIQRPNASGLVIRDSTIRGDGKSRLQFAVYNIGGMITIERNDLSVISDAISTSSGLIADNYIHDPKAFPGDHLDMIQSTAGPSGGQRLIIRHNTIINTHDQTSAIALFQDFGVQHDATIENNLLAGGGYALYGGAGSKGKSRNIRIVNNVFSRQVFPKGGHFGPVAHFDSDGPGNVWQSNVWAETGEAVTP